MFIALGIGLLGIGALFAFAGGGSTTPEVSGAGGGGPTPDGPKDPTETGGIGGSGAPGTGPGSPTDAQQGTTTNYKGETLVAWRTAGGVVIWWQLGPAGTVGPTDWGKDFVLEGWNSRQPDKDLTPDLWWWRWVGS